MRDAIGHLDFRARAFALLRRARYFSFACPRRTQERARTAKLTQKAQGRMTGVTEKYPRENDTPPGACRTPGNRSCVASTRASCPRHAVAMYWRKGIGIVPIPLRACRPRLPAAQLPPGRAARHPGPHFSEEPEQRQNRSARQTSGQAYRFSSKTKALQKWAFDPGRHSMRLTSSVPLYSSHLSLSDYFRRIHFSHSNWASMCLDVEKLNYHKDELFPACTFAST